MPQANSATSRPRVTSPSASESTLPCSAVMSAAMSLLALVEQLAEGEEHAGALRERGVGPLLPRATRRDLTTSSTSDGRGEVEHAGLLAGRGVEDGRRALGGAGPRLAVDEVGDAGGRAHGGFLRLQISVQGYAG